jgi:hypothetical protein
VPEWFNGAVSKTVVPLSGTEGSNPSLSAPILSFGEVSELLKESRWQSGCRTSEKPCSGEVSEWLKEHAWKACVGTPYRGFESRPLRQENCGAVAQLGERYVRNVQVVGSNPIGSTRLC